MRRLTAALTRRVSRLRRERERGSVGILVAIVLAGGVLLGACAIVIDIGQLYAEREQLQSGADAAAMAVAQNCIRTPAACGNQAAAAGVLADGNATDGASAVTVVCGRAKGLPACPAATGNRTDCMGDPPASGNYAEVHTATEMADGSTLLPPTFAGALLGNDGYEGTRVGACARVAWGPPLSATGLGVTVSTCEWQQLTGGAPTYWPPGTVPPASVEGVIYLHDPSRGNTCPAGPSGWDAPGGFGWLTDTGGNCTTTVSASGTFGGDTGVSASNDCQSALTNLYTSRKPVLMPIYDGIRGSGANTTYHLSGFSSFVVTGYALSGFSAKSWLSGRTLCSSEDKCLYGYFTSAILPSGGNFGAVDYGTNILKLAG